MQVAVEDITPNLAEKYLSLNFDGNRTFRKMRVQSYADMMMRGQWATTGDTIRFDKKGRLVDGQHRLKAVATSGVTLHNVIVVRDLEDDAYAVLDSGASRLVGDAMGKTGGGSNRNRAAAIRLLLVVECGGDPRMSVDKFVITRPDIVEYFEGHEGMIRAAESVAGRMRHSLRKTNPSAWMAFVLLVWKSHSSTAHEFFEGCISGSNLATGDPRLALIKWIGNSVNQDNGVHLGIYIKAWNAWVTQKNRTNLVFRADETFPTLVNTKFEIL